MKIVRPSHESKYDIWIYSILIISSALAAYLAVANIKITPDSMRFGIVSQQILSGNGIRVPVIRLEDNYVPVNGAVPFLDQMPLLPILFAMLGGVAPYNYLPAQIINFISHVLVSVLTFLVMKKIYDNKGIALLTGMLVSVSYPMLKRTNHISSESLFIALIVTVLYFLVLSRKSDRSLYRRYLFIASGCASAAILIRNAGIVLILLFFWEAFILIKNKRPESKYASTILAISMPVIITAGMFVRNYIVAGSLRGFIQASPERSYLEATIGTIGMIFQQFQLGRNSIILITLLLLLFTMYVLINANLRKELLKLFNGGLDLIVVFIVSYTALICLTMATQQWRYELRYVFPLVPFLFMMVILMTVLVWGRMKFKRFSKLSLAGIILSLSIIAFGTCYKTFLNLPYFFSDQTKQYQYSILHSCTYKWIKENYGGNTIIATNKAFHLSFFGGYSTIALPHKKFNITIPIPDDMESVLPDRMTRFGARLIALFEGAEKQYDGSYIARLFNQRESNEKFNLMYECSDGVVYNLKE